MQQIQHALDQPHLAFLGVSLLVSGLLYTLHRSRRTDSRYPPGPPPDPILGNVRQFPRTEWHNTFTVWQKQYYRPPGVCRHLVSADYFLEIFDGSKGGPQFYVR